MIFDRLPAHRMDVGSTAVLRCNCVAVALSHDTDFVQFGIERSGCESHTNGDVVATDKTETVTPTKPISPRAAGD
jgi:hypothetical protein